MMEQEDVEFVTSHKYIKNSSTNGTVPTEHLLNISGRLQTPKRIKEKRKEESQKDNNTGRKLKMRGGPQTQKNSLTVGKSAGTEKDFQGIKGECSRWSVEGRTK